MAKTATKTPTETPPALQSADAPVVPWVRYDRFTVAEILQVCERGGKAVRRRVLAYERAHQQRPVIIQALENWGK